MDHKNFLRRSYFDKNLNRNQTVITFYSTVQKWQTIEFTLKASIKLVK